MNLITLVRYDESMTLDLWEVYFSAIRKVCIKHYSKEQVEAWAPDSLKVELLHERFQKLDPFVAKINEKIVGYADIQENGLIDHFFVHGDYQAHGIGNKLMLAILDKAKDLPSLHSEVSHTAKHFFLKFGFEVQKIQEIEIRGCMLQNNLMVRTNEQ